MTASRNSRTPFTYRTWDLITLKEKDPLVLGAVSFGEEQNGHGTFQGSLNVAAPHAQKINFLNSTLTGRTLLGVDYAGELVWGGILWTRRYRKSTTSFTLGASGGGSYLKARLQAADYTSTWEAGAAATAIFKKVLEDMSGVAYSPTIQPVVNGAGGSAVKVSYPLTTPQSVESILSLLSVMGLGAGFDWQFSVAYKPGTTTPALTFNMYYPLQGKNIAETGIVLRGRDCLDFEWPEDSTNQAWKITENGGGGLKGEATYTEPGLAGWPLLESLVSRTNVSELAALAQTTQGDLSAFAWPVATPTFELPLWHVEEGVRPGWFSFDTLNIGDEFVFKVDPQVGVSRNIDPRFPKGIESIERLASWSAKIADTGLSVLTYTTAPPPAENGSPPEPESINV